MNSSFKADCMKGKVALITGGATGICRGIAELFLRHGCQVMITSRKEENLKKAVEYLKSRVAGASVDYVVSDVRKNEEVEAAVDKTLAVFNRIDILINGAAGNFLAPAHRLSPNAFKTVIDIDTVGTFLFSRAVFNKCMQKQKSGSIVNISASLHYNGCLLQAHAGAAKAAVDALTKHLAVEWGPFNVRVNGVAPGPIEGTEGLSRLDPHANSNAVTKGDKASTNAQPAANKSKTSLMKEVMPLQRNGTTDDIGNACMFLSLKEASFITAHTMVVDGGQSMTSSNFVIFDEKIRSNWAQAKL